MSATATRVPHRPPGVDAIEGLILVRVDRAVRVGERELRYQLEHKDEHPLAQAEELLDVLVQLEAEGLVESEWTFRLTARGRERLAGLAGSDGRPS